MNNYVIHILFMNILQLKTIFYCISYNVFNIVEKYFISTNFI